MEDGVFVTNIKATIDQIALRSFFNQFGTVAELNLQPDKFNEGNKVCYLKFTSSEGAAKCVKQGDRTTLFGEPLKIALKKYTERNPNKIVENKTVETNNGISRMQSFGRGRGTFMSSPGKPGCTSDVVELKYLELPLERKCTVEIIELKSLTNILVRPLLLTEKCRPELYSLLESHNENANRLLPIRNPEINGFYLAKWMDDNKFYRAKIISIISDGKYEVCFVDEGTTGDIVTELRAIPHDLSIIPCQFVPCTANCNDSAELIELVLKEGSDKEVSIYSISSKKINDKYAISIYIDNKNLIDIYKAKLSTDPRVEKLPNKSDIKAHTVGQQLSKCRIAKNSKDSNHVTVTLSQQCTLNPSPLSTCPVANDLLAYIDNSGNVHRCVVDSAKFMKDHLAFTVNMIDEEKQLEASVASLMQCPLVEVCQPSRSIRAVIDGPRAAAECYDDVDSVILSDLDVRKNLYAIKIVETKKCAAVAKTKVGETLVGVLSHVESMEEFYAQLSDETSLMSLEAVQAEINDEGYAPGMIGSARDMKVGQVVVAPFQEVRYRALVREVDTGKNRALCFFMDYGNSEWLSATEVVRATEAVVKVGPGAFRCRMAVPVRAECEREAVEMLLEYCGRGEVEVRLTVVAEEQAGQVLLVNVCADNKSSFADILECKGLAGAPPAGKGPAGVSPASKGPAGGSPASKGPAGAPPASKGPAGVSPASKGPAGVSPASKGPAGAPPASKGPVGAPPASNGPVSTPINAGHDHLDMKEMLKKKIADLENRIMRLETVIGGQ